MYQEKIVQPKTIMITKTNASVTIGKIKFTRNFYEKYEKQIQKIVNFGDTMFNSTWTTKDALEFEEILKKESNS